MNGGRFDYQNDQVAEDIFGWTISPSEASCRQQTGTGEGSSVSNIRTGGLTVNDREAIKRLLSCRNSCTDCLTCAEHDEALEVAISALQEREERSKPTMDDCKVRGVTDTVKVSWSGGKDSTCAMLMHIESGHCVKAVCYIPMFTAEIPLITKQHYDFILNAADLFREMGAEVKIVYGMTYYDYCTRITTRGKYKGLIIGFPYVGYCGFRRDSKIKALNDADVGNYDYEDLGIAYDEGRRHSQLNDRKRSILVERMITEEMAFYECKRRGLLSPNYATQKRDGCALCFNAKESERSSWLEEYPEAVPILIRLQDMQKRDKPGRYPLRGHKWFIDGGADMREVDNETD